MEKKKGKRKMKKGVKRLIIILLIIIIFALCIIYLINNFTIKKPVNTEAKVVDQIDDYGYVLEDNETKLYEKLFKKLTTVLSEEEIDYKEYASLISQLYIADFYNLDNKITKNDVGGVQFVHSDAQENFLVKAKDTLYKNVKSNIYGDRKQELPIVTSIEEKSVEQTTYELNNEEVDAYEVTLNWQYEKDLGYDDEKTIILIKDDNKLGIVETKSVEKDSE